MISISNTNKSFLTVKIEKEEAIAENKFFNKRKETQKNEIVLHILPPKRRLYRSLMTFEIENNKEDIDNIDNVYEIVTDILNNNSQKITFKVDEVDNMLTVIDVTKLMQDYVSFVVGVVNNPN